jgi:hypothetical protein
MTRSVLTRPSRRALAWVLTLLAGAAVLAAVPTGPGAAAKDEPKPKQDLPADLALVPHDAVGFQSVRVADVWGDEGTKELRAQFVKDNPDFNKRLDKTIAVAPADVVRLTAVVLEGRPPLAAPSSRPAGLTT